MPIPGYEPALCDLFIDSCDKRLSIEDLFKALIGSDVNGCPVFKTSTSISITQVVRVPLLLRVSNAGNIAAGSRKVDVFNSGAADGIFLGTLLKVGESATFIAGGLTDIFGIIAYDATGTEFVITTIF